ncbi:hypothetical protein KA005_57165 [bacterium]|nr:hypothetical protein [bacterium]
MMHSDNIAQGSEKNPTDNLIKALNSGGSSQEAYNQIADNLYACLNRWSDADIDSLFALTTSLDLLAQFCRDTLPDNFAEEFIQDAVSPHEDDV